MASEFLNSALIPGSPVAHHEHRRLMIILISALIVAVAVGLFLWLTPTGQVEQPPLYVSGTPSTHSQITLTQAQAQEKAAALSSVIQTRVKLTPAQQKAKAAQIQSLR